MGVLIQHIIQTDGQYWECSCGRGGTASTETDVDIASDKHIDYSSGDTRVDRYPG